MKLQGFEIFQVRLFHLPFHQPCHLCALEMLISGRVADEAPDVPGTASLK